MSQAEAGARSKLAIRLLPLGPYDANRVAHIRVAPEQVKFSGQPADAFAKGEAGVDLHAIALEDGPLVGFFKIDTAYATRMGFAARGELGLRGFLIDRDRQGQGLATTATWALPAYLAHRYPGAPALVLTVNCANPAAIASYLKGGFTDTGQLYAGGGAGPQHVMRMGLASRTAARSA